MSAFDQYNFGGNTAIIKGEPIKELPPPMFVHVLTQIYKKRILFVDTGWNERLQTTNVIHVYKSTVLVRSWDTTDYESLNIPIKTPKMMWGKMLDLDDLRHAGQHLNWCLTYYFSMKMTDSLSIRTMIDRLKRLPLYARLKFSEEIVKNLPVKISKTLGWPAR